MVAQEPKQVTVRKQVLDNLQPRRKAAQLERVAIEFLIVVLIMVVLIAILLPM